MNLHIPVNEGDQKQGSMDASLVLVEYGDYECPYCGAAYPVVKQLQAHFGRELLFIFRNFPLSEIHPHALMAAYVAEAAGLQRKFWKLHDLIYENQADLSQRRLITLAESAGVEVDKLLKDMSSFPVIEKVENDMEGGARSGVNGTPTFFINGLAIVGAQPLDVFKQVIKKELAGEIPK